MRDDPITSTEASPGDISEPNDLGSRLRTLQRYLVPSLLVSLIVLLRDGSMVSRASKVQLSKLVRFGRGDKGLRLRHTGFQRNRHGAPYSGTRVTQVRKSKKQRGQGQCKPRPQPFFQ